MDNESINQSRIVIEELKVRIDSLEEIIDNLESVVIKVFRGDVYASERDVLQDLSSVRKK